MRTSAKSDRIVCALDDSDHAASVLDTAAALAGRLDLWLTVVHSPIPDVFVVGERRRDVIRRGEDFVASVSAGHEVNQVIVQPGHPAEVLTENLRAGAAMVVVGSRGRGPRRAALFGSVYAELARHAPCAVVIVPPDGSISMLSPQPGIVCGLDGSEEAVHALEWATRIAWTTGGRLLPVHVCSDPPGPVEEDAAVLSQVEHEVARLARPLEASVYVRHGDPAEQLDELARSQDADLIVVGSHGHGAIRAALGGSVRSRLAASAGTPVVVVPNRAQLDDPWAPTARCSADPMAATALPNDA
jgi:nucleotide-binding universal stress UspA family protein